MSRKGQSHPALDQAIYLIQRKGYATTASASPDYPDSLPHSTIYHHRASKEIALQRTLAQITYSFWESCLSPAYDESCSRTESWHTVIDRLEAYFKQHRSCVMAQLLLEGFADYPGTQIRLNVFFVNWRDAFTHMLTPHYGHVRANTLAIDAIAQLEGALVTLPLFIDDDPLSRACTSLRALL